MKQIVNVMAVVALLLSTIVIATVPIQAQENPQREANVQPGVGHPNTEFAFYATGFYDEEIVDIWLNTPDGRVIDAEVEQLYESSPTGRADWYWEAPGHAQAGTWQMVARGRDSGVQHVIPFRIEGGTPTFEPPETDDVETYNVHPKVGPPGTEFAFYATGFDVDENAEDAANAEYEETELWVETPNWQRIKLNDQDDPYIAAPSGRADWTWTAPANAQTGVWHMVILGEESGLKHVIPFEVRH
jgi:hypothetical protein